MIDTHCHLTDPRLSEQLAGVLERARLAGVSRMVTIGTSVADSLAAVELCAGRDNLRCVIGVHPNYTEEVPEADLSQLRGLQAAPQVVALGEMGLDYHYETPRDRQRRFFDRQLQIASEYARPVVIHCREAVTDTLAVMKDYKLPAAVFHCFTGTAEEAERILAAGYYLGFTGPITYKRNDALREVVRLTPLDRMLVETDAPYLSPEPMRKQKINEPSLVMHTAAMIAQVKGITLTEVDRYTTDNAQVLYQWPAG